MTASRPPPADPGRRPIGCTRSRVAPLVDAVVVGAVAATVASGVAGATSVPLAIAASPFAFSAGAGLHETSRCRAMDRAPLPVWVSRSPPPEIDAQQLGSIAIDTTKPPPVTGTREPSGRPGERVPDRVAPPRPGDRDAPRPRRLPDAVVIRALDAYQPALIRCFKRARRLDARLVDNRLTVRLQLAVDDTGSVISVTTDTTSSILADCIQAIARKLAFKTAGSPASVDIPLRFAD